MHEGPLTSRLLEAEGIRHGFGERRAAPPDNLATAQQVHGTTVFWPEASGKHAVDADVLLSRAGIGVAVATADCVPVLLLARRMALGAAVHAGWKGTLAGATGTGVGELLAAGAVPGDLVASIGPSIGPCCYEVSLDLAARFSTRFGAGVIRRREDKVFLDLPLANALELRRHGLALGQVEVLGLCTFCARSADGTPRFNSFRRDGPDAGRQFSYIVP